MSLKSIESIAVELRDIMGLHSPYISIEKVYAALQDSEDIDFEIVEDVELGENMAEAYPDKGLILIRDSVYSAACDGDARARFTMAHELGHIILHIGQAPSASFARGEQPDHKIYEDCEWQADTFASAFLMDKMRITKSMSINDVSSLFGTSLSAAKIRLNTIQKEKA